MKGYMYILLCSDGSYFTGSTNNIDACLLEHKSGDGAHYTSLRLPVELVFLEEFDRLTEAFYRERQVQSWSRKKKKALIDGPYNQLKLRDIGGHRITGTQGHGDTGF